MQKLDILLACLITTYVFIAPFTKVEESFNVQAIHDILYHALNIEKYDHLEFPGVVPRTFLGAIPLAAVTLPFKLAASTLGLPKLTVLVAARIALGLLSAAALFKLKKSVASAFGSETASWLILLTASQFHLPYYMSRPLPNTLATAITTVGVADWIQGSHPHRALALLTFTSIVFRCDAILLAGLVGLHLLSAKKVSLLSGIVTGTATAAASLVLTVAVDSFFWARWVWPEGEVLWFNTALNKSGEWGIAPPLWYFTSALPRALHAAFPLAFLGAAANRNMRPPFLIALGFVMLYSNLGHKELRFLFPVLPLWNLSAAAGIAYLRGNSRKSTLWRLAYFAACAAVVAGVGTVVLGLLASRVNYPGGVALQKLHHMHARNERDVNNTISVHIGVLPAMTGVSRFGEIEQQQGGQQPSWHYSKDEGDFQEVVLVEKKARFDYLVSDKEVVKGYRMVEAVEGFAGWRWAGGSPTAVVAGFLKGLPRFAQFPPLRIATAPTVFIHEKEFRL